MPKKFICAFLLSLQLLTIPCWAQDPAGRLIALRGRVEIGPNWAAAVLNQDLVEGSEIRTFQQSRAVLLLADETQLKLNANTSLVLQSANRSSSLISRISAAGARSEQSIMNLRSGQLYVRSKKTPASVRVDTPAVTAAIRGTEFDVQVAPDGETRTTVLEGSIDYRNDFGAIQVNSGEQGIARVGEAPTKIVIVNPQDAVQWTFFYTAAVSPRDYPFVQRSPAAAQSELQGTIADPVRRAMLLHDAGQPDEALQALEGVTTPESHAVRGWLLLEMHQLLQAEKEFEAAPLDLPRTRLGKSLIFLRTDQYENALKVVEPTGDDPGLLFQKALVLTVTGGIGEALPILDDLAGKNGWAALADSLKATILVGRNSKDEALAAARAALQADPSSPSARVGLSRVLQAFFELPQARDEASQALELDPNFIDAQAQYAKLLFGFGLTGEAEKVIERSLQETPDDAQMNSLMGFILLARADTSEAVTRFQHAVSLDSTLADPHLGLGLALMRRNRHDDAAAEFLAAATLEPRLSIYYSYLAKAFYELRQFEQAFTSLQTAEELDPRDPTPRFYSGIFLDDLNRPGAAVTAYQDSIRLNDNRAVYRSRLILDQDLASRNISLARAYNRLGLTEWGNSEAVLSVLNDPTNSSAHLFLGNTFLALPGRTLAGGSESLLNRLLLPVNANAFNAFNDYTTLFDLPRAYWTLEGRYGSFDAFGGTFTASGGTSRLAYRSTTTYDRTAGFRPVNDDAKDWVSYNYLKMALTQETDLLLSYSYGQDKSGDLGSPVLVNEFNDPNLRNYSRSHRGEIGVHHRFRPGSDLIAIFSARSFDQVSDDPDKIQRPYITYGLRTSTKAPDLDFQISHLLNVGRFSFRYGADVYEGRSRTLATVFYFFPGDDQLYTQEYDFNRYKVRSKTLFANTDYRLRPDLILSAGINYAWLNDNNRLDNVQKPDSYWNPQAGVLYSPFETTKLRFAFFQNLQTQRAESLVPAQLMGFPILQNESSGSRGTAYNLGWDQNIGRNAFFRNQIYWKDRKLQPFDFATGSTVVFDGKLYGGRTTMEYLMFETLSLVGDYAITHSLDLSSLRHDHEVNASLTWVQPWGLYVTLNENYLRQTGELGDLRTRVKVFTTAISASWEMPRKVGLVELIASNIFDRRYEFLADPEALETRIPARNVRLRLRFNF